MQFLGETDFKFVQVRNSAFMVSCILILAGLVSLAIKGGPDLSIDFEGGTLIQVRFDKPVPISDLRDAVGREGYGGAEIQNFGQDNEYIIRVEKISEADLAAAMILDALGQIAPRSDWKIVSKKEMRADRAAGSGGGNLVVVEADSIGSLEVLKEQLRERGVGIVAATRESAKRVAFNMPFLGVEAKAAEKLSSALSDNFPERIVDIRRTESVGPRIGEELKNKAWAAIVISLFGILIYISWRFEFKFAVGAILALMHDVLVTVGIFSILNKEISLAIVAALLMIVGYSLNDTIVVFDRIRENFSLRRRGSYDSMVNISINESLSRTIITSLTTLVVVAFLLFMGGEVIRDFAFALMMGIIIGTYSSIFVASPVLVEWHNRITSRHRAR